MDDPVDVLLRDAVKEGNNLILHHVEVRPQVLFMADLDFEVILVFFTCQSFFLDDLRVGILFDKLIIIHVLSLDVLGQVVNSLADLLLHNCVVLAVVRENAKSGKEEVAVFEQVGSIPAFHHRQHDFLHHILVNHLSDHIRLEFLFLVSCKDTEHESFFLLRDFFSRSLGRLVATEVKSGLVATVICLQVKALGHDLLEAIYQLSDFVLLADFDRLLVTLWFRSLPHIGITLIHIPVFNRLLARNVGRKEELTIAANHLVNHVHLILSFDEALHFGDDLV